MKMYSPIAKYIYSITVNLLAKATFTVCVSHCVTHTGL